MGSGEEAFLKAAVVLDYNGFLEEVLPELEEVCLDSWREALPFGFSILMWKGMVVRSAW